MSSPQGQQVQQDDLLQKLLVMEEDISSYGNEDRETIMLRSIQDRLNKSTDAYLSSIKDSVEYLKTKRSKYLLRKINKL